MINPTNAGNTFAGDVTINNIGQIQFADIGRRGVASAVGAGASLTFNATGGEIGRAHV